MAERRMFSKAVIDSDLFLDMPLTAQTLYFHMAMRADDDGFLDNHKKIQRIVGANDDDMKRLVDNQFIIMFESGVTVIRHWQVHNSIRKDRSKPTVYQAEKAMLTTENGVYSLLDCQPSDNQKSTKCQPSDNQVSTKCQPSDNQMSAQVRLGKVSIVKEKEIYKEKEKADAVDNATATPKKPKHKYGEYKNVLLTDDELEKLKTEFPQDWQERIESLSGYLASTGKKYKNHLATIRVWARKSGGQQKARERPPEETAPINPAYRTDVAERLIKEYGLNV